MALLRIFLILVSGILASRYFLESACLLARVGFVIFFSLTVVPFVNIHLALFCGRYISYNLVTVNSFVVIVFFILLQFIARYKKDTHNSLPGKNCKYDVLPLFICGFCAVFSFYYYSNKEFLFSLGSYLIKGDAGCFLMQTFKTNALLNQSSLLNNKIYEIICTPGNILFTSTLLPILKLYSFKAAYVLFTCTTFIFVYLIVNTLIANRVVAIAVALFSVFNPYMMSVEVLDRNVMALSVTAMFFYLILEYPEKVFLHGLVFGILSGLGLRFLPLLFIIPVFILYLSRKFNAVTFITFLSAFIITFTFNVPHIFFNGLNSLGETESTPNLILLMVKNRLRTPFLPFPNLLFYMVNILSYFGYLVSGIILLGTFRLWRLDKKVFFACFCWFAAVLLVLSYQKNWIESDKSRIILEAFLSLYIYFACGLEEIFRNRRSVRPYVQLCASCLLLASLVFLYSRLDFNQDMGFFKRKYLYQEESRAYHLLTKNRLLNIKLYPDYGRLFSKLDIGEKQKEEKIIIRKLFPEGNFPARDRFKEFYLDWQNYFAKAVLIVPEKQAREYRYIKIDFDKLAGADANCVVEVNNTDLCALDLKDEANLFDVYYADLKTSWQREILPVCIMVNKEEINSLRKLYIDLNAFKSFGKDDAGFDMINSINFNAVTSLQKKAFDSEINSFPLVGDGTSVILRVPVDIMVVVRNWFINDKGAPYKTDSWYIKREDSGNWKTEFFYNEPESYL